MDEPKKKDGFVLNCVASPRGFIGSGVHLRPTFFRWKTQTSMLSKVLRQRTILELKGPILLGMMSSYLEDPLHSQALKDLWTSTVLLGLLGSLFF